MSNPNAYLSAGKESKQDVRTPPELFEYVKLRWPNVGVDLAASDENALCPIYITGTEDSLKQDWGNWLLDDVRSLMNAGYLNPPFKHISPWMQKCHTEAKRGCHVIALVPNTQEASWFWEYVMHGPCTVHPLKGRLAFPGYTDKKGRPQVAGQGHALVDWHGGEWGGIHPVNWKAALEKMRRSQR